MNNIIQQYHYAFDNFIDLSNKEANSSGYHFHSTKTVVENLLNHKHLFIIAEPGYGKTTLIDQIKKYLDELKISNTRYEGSSYRKITDQEPPEYLIFDALDESRQPIPSVIDLLDYIKKYNVKLIISNRIHYTSQIERWISGIDFTYIRLLPFGDWQIAQMMSNRLLSHGFTDEHIDDIIKKSKAGSPHSILKTPRYLNEFCNYIIHNSKRPEEIRHLKKSELFEKVIYYKLESENKLSEINRNYTHIAKRVLERLSLVMEIHQSNEIKKEEFITFLDQANSNINLILLTSISIDELWERVMKTTGDNLKFEHTEFQEYLAAKELSRIGHSHQIITELMINNEINIIRPNWIDVLNFSVDLDPGFVNPILSFITSNKFQNINEKLIEIILSVNPEEINAQTRAKIFSICFDYYSYTGKYLFTISTVITSFYENDNQNILIPTYAVNTISSSIFHIVSNQICIVESLATKDKLNDAQIKIWISYLCKLLKVESFVPMYNAIFYALIAFKAKRPILNVMAFFESQPDPVFNLYLHPVSVLASNDPAVVNLLIRSIRSKRRMDDIPQALANIRGEQSLIILFTYLCQEPANIANPNRYLHNNSYGTLFEHIAKLNSSKLDGIIQNYLIGYHQKSESFPEKHEMIASSLSYLIKKNDSLLDLLLDLDNFIDTAENYLDEIFASCTLADFQKIESKLVETGNWMIGVFIEKCKENIRRSINIEIHNYIINKYPANRTLPSVGSSETKTIKELRDYYTDDPTKYNLGLIPYLVEKFHLLKNLLEEKDKNYLMGVIKSALKQYDPDKLKVSIKRVSVLQNEITYNYGIWMRIDSYFKAAYLLNDIVTIKKNRIKFLKSLPAMELRSDDDIKIVTGIFKIIGRITTGEHQTIFDIYSSRKDDLLLLNINSFTKIVKEMKLRFLFPLLIKFLSSNKLRTSEKKEILETIGYFSEDRNDYKVLNRIFNSNKNDEETRVLAEIANSFLIIKFEDDEAIKWRFRELKSRLKEHDPEMRFNGLRPVSAFENEMDNQKFGRCFLGLVHPIIENLMRDLLTYSFELRNNRLHLSYSNYLQSLIFKYYKSVIDIGLLKKVRNHVASYHPLQNTYTFNPMLEQLSAELNERSVSSRTFLDAIHVLNETLNKSFLPITGDIELKETILNIIKKDIVNLIENEGFYKVSQQLSGQKHKNNLYINEDLIQKTLKIALERSLLASGFRKIDIYREVESLDGLRYDYLIKYGLFGPIVVELKLLHNEEIQNSSSRKVYKQKLIKYLSANNGQGLYLVFQTKESQAHLAKYHDLVSEYSDINGLDIALIKCQ
ncbi:NACHT domain-containing protein [Chitinophaga arvensicola]|uniref:Uncharacterized protein n=1 Tax=Chitinophaga arvensicola TaxID=29529 RepID=A0A1I0SE28_9BACT|nr:hypothetical protein [Chitinophaga arvensicola]SEW57439.1 hypothetical protein SAMN04488122_6785 [Chitinophaga arvensicola]